MITPDKFLEQYRIYKNFIEEKENRDDGFDCEDNNSEGIERQEEIEEIMDEYWVDEVDAEEILDSM